MPTDQEANDFAESGPRLDGRLISIKSKTEFLPPLPDWEMFSWTTEVHAPAMHKIARDLNSGRFAEAAIRVAQTLGPTKDFGAFVKAGFNPAQPRNHRGEWSFSDGGSSRRSAKPPNDQSVAVIDPYCKIVKELCIVEATATLPTADFGASFFKAMNSCMDRHGCLGRA